ncbi:hypothetical protein, partial [Pseudomonas syringae]|uniref:hypothetical protein n=1 Tax=Pseudomonas syringae TaxID=317 RepID=UPI001E5292C7
CWQMLFSVFVRPLSDPAGKQLDRPMMRTAGHRLVISALPDAFWLSAYPLEQRKCSIDSGGPSS